MEQFCEFYCRCDRQLFLGRTVADPRVSTADRADSIRHRFGHRHVVTPQRLAGLAGGGSSRAGDSTRHDTRRGWFDWTVGF